MLKGKHPIEGELGHGPAGRVNPKDPAGFLHRRFCAPDALLVECVELFRSVGVTRTCTVRQSPIRRHTGRSVDHSTPCAGNREPPAGQQGYVSLRLSLSSPWPGIKPVTQATKPSGRGFPKKLVADSNEGEAPKDGKEDGDQASSRCHAEIL